MMDLNNKVYPKDIWNWLKGILPSLPKRKTLKEMREKLPKWPKPPKPLKWDNFVEQELRIHDKREDEWDTRRPPTRPPPPKPQGLKFRKQAMRNVTNNIKSIVGDAKNTTIINGVERDFTPKEEKIFNDGMNTLDIAMEELDREMEQVDRRLR